MSNAERCARCWRARTSSGEYRNRAPDYQDTAEKCDDGLVTEAITALRGRLVHDFVNGFGSQSAPIYPRPELYPSEDLWPGDNLV
jgi:hypothetical protein